MQIKRIIVSGSIFLTMSLSVWAKLDVVWPTEHPPHDMRDSFFSRLQATESKEIQSGNFGCVRTNGHQFHEGIDLRSLTRDKSGEPTDIVRSVLPGVVVYTNANRSKSSYGRYIIIEHFDSEMSFFSLYAHLASIDKGIARGAQIQGGQRIAVMGRSASYTIPRNRAHLHFEICLRLSDNFQSWYSWKKFESKNDHGNFNGMNLVGIDPANFFEETQWNQVDQIRRVLEQEKTAFTVMVSTKMVPDFVRRYPALVEGTISEENLAGWRVEFTYYGAPKKWTPLVSKSGQISEGKLGLVDYDKTLLSVDACRKMIRFKNGKPIIGPGLQTSLQLLFGFR